MLRSRDGESFDIKRGGKTAVRTLPRDGVVSRFYDRPTKPAAN